MKKKIKDQKGIALVVVILMLLALSALGVAAINLTNVGTLITSNTKTSKQAFYLAEAGAERAREFLRTRAAGGNTLSNELNSIIGIDGVLVNSGDVSNFSSTDDIPYINTTSLGNGSFKVYLTNDTVDGVTSASDTNGIVTLTSFGYGPNNSKAVVQVRVMKNGGINLPNLPGAISLAGPNVVFDAPNSNAFTIDGGTHPAIAVNSAQSLTTITNNSAVQKRADNYTGAGGTPSVQNLTFGSPWDTIADLQKLYTGLKNNADFTSSSDPGFTLGDAANKKVVVIDGDFTLNPTTGAGILLVTGQLTLNGNFSYDGIILVVGSGNILRHGGGDGTISGGIYVANIKGSDGQINTGDDVFGNPTFDTTGGGNSTITYDATAQTSAANLTNSFPFTRISWKQF
ncbi:MAG: hypothetical protein A2Y79_06245 [Deltaproteobacteria bacterium RBG_13_43_22]|nr:MAG: hypothetical protein A2Y79_06245 [Deltaproteobacteria bacterium RBG_13_43_22]